MALRTGLSGIEKLINSAALGTIELSTGLQISGVFTDVIAQMANQFTFKLQEKLH
jgi:phenylalanine-4-hydroxylase